MLDQFTDGPAHILRVVELYGDRLRIGTGVALDGAGFPVDNDGDPLRDGLVTDVLPDGRYRVIKDGLDCVGTGGFKPVKDDGRGRVVCFPASRQSWNRSGPG